MKWWVYILIFIISQLSGSVFAILLSVIFNLSPFNSLPYALAGANILALLLIFISRPAPRTRTTHWREYSLKAILLAPPVIMLVTLMLEMMPELPNYVGDNSLQQIMTSPIGMLTVCIICGVSRTIMFITNSIFRSGIFAHSFSPPSKRATILG